MHTRYGLITKILYLYSITFSIHLIHVYINRHDIINNIIKFDTNTHISDTIPRCSKSMVNDDDLSFVFFSEFTLHTWISQCCLVLASPSKHVCSSEVTRLNAAFKCFSVKINMAGLCVAHSGRGLF